jgi:tetratricopeptide (TPR) repeat protein
MTSTSQLGAKSRGTRTPLLLGLTLALVTLAVYWQVGRHQFVNIDDPSFVVDNVHVATGLTIDNLLWALSPQPGLGWHPVTWLAHMLDVELYGLNPRGHHLTNLFLHVASTLLLFTLLYRLTNAPWKCAFVAALFALHPLHVESVAWVAERRDVLSALFGFLSLWLYAEYVTQRRRRFYLFALLAFVLGLMSKPMLVTFPVIMLLLDYWPLNRFSADEQSAGPPRRCVALSSWLPLLREKIPFLACSFFSVAITLSVPSGSSGPVKHVTSLGERMANAITVYVSYMAKMLWPVDLAVFYPFPSSIPSWQVIGYLLILLAITAVVIRSGRRHPYLVVGWFWYLITLGPVLGIVPFGPHAMADRYTYIPLIGLFIAAAWGIPALTKPFPGQRTVLAPLAGLVVLAAAVLTFQQVKQWRDSQTLFEHALRVTSRNWLAHNNLAVALLQQDQVVAAVEQLQRGIEINPQDIYAHYNLGGIYLAHGHFDEAITEIIQSSAPGSEVANLSALGNQLFLDGRFGGAIKLYRKVLLLDPDAIEARNNLGVSYLNQGDYARAIGEFEKILARFPNHADARYNLELAREQMKRVNEAP